MRQQSYIESGAEWVGRLPGHWHVKPMFSVVEKMEEKNTGSRVQNLLSLSYGKIVKRDYNSNFGLLPESFDTYQIVYPGDIVMRLLDLQNDHVSLRVGLVNEEGIVTSAYVSVRPIKGLVPQYAAYLLYSYDVKKVFYSFGGGCRQSMRFEDLKRLPIPFPPTPEQQCIAAYLDEQTAKIDRLMDMRRRQMALLKEQRGALIQQAVTRGLNPNAPMKDSGLPWLGEIPAHWRITRLKYLCSHIVDCLHSTPNYVPDGDYPAIRTADVVPGYIDTDNAKRLSHDDYLIQVQRLIPKEGDIVYSREGERFGIAACVPAGITLCISQRMMHFRVRRDVDSRFVMWQLNTKPVYSQAVVYVFGATSPHINVETITNYVLVEPPLGEQMEIAGFIESGTAKLDLLHSAYARQLTLLTEYRSALIHECVTGKRRVPEPSFPDGGTAHAL